MTTLSRVRVESVEGQRLTCHVDHVYGSHWPWCLVSSRTLALHFLTESLRPEIPGREITWQQTDELAQAAPLWQALGGDHRHDEDRNRKNVGRFVACVGMVDHKHCDGMWADMQDERWNEPTIPDTVERPSATCLIAVTDPQWLVHLTPGMEWDSTAYDHDEKIIFDPTWRTPDVTALAKGITASQDFSGMPVLADALQEAGCDSNDLLNHLRDTNATHVRGCWALDLVLGKE
jgi:hypothetical protein